MSDRVLGPSARRVALFVSLAVVAAGAATGIVACTTTNVVVRSTDGGGGGATSGDGGIVLGQDPDGGSADGGATGCDCQWGQRCIDGACRSVRTANVSLGTTTQRTNGTATQFSYQNQVCFYDYDGSGASSAPLTPTLVDGPCKVYEGVVSTSTPTPASPLFRGDIGTVTITGGRAGTNTLAPTSGSDCYRSNFEPTTPIFGEGDHLVVKGTGGADFPAFELAIDVPPPTLLDDAPLTPGSPVTLTWSGSTSDDVTVSVGSLSSTKYVYASCIVPDTGSFTVPGTVTQKLLASGTYKRVDRTRIARFEPSDAPTLVQVQAVTGETRVP